PEIFSLLYLGCFLAVLWRAEERPALLWLLAPLQVLWVNTQGLFVLGPVLLGFLLAARAARLLWHRGRGPAGGAADWRWWRHAGGAALAGGAARPGHPDFPHRGRLPPPPYPHGSHPPH